MKHRNEYEFLGLLSVCRTAAFPEGNGRSHEASLLSHATKLGSAPKQSLLMWFYLDGSSQVGAVRSWLRHDFMERLAWPLPVRCLERQKSGKGSCRRESQPPCVSGGFDYGTHQRECQRVPKNAVSHSLA